MRAVILAAGRGRRLERFIPDGRPKSLLEFGGKSLLGRPLQQLRQNGLDAVDIVIGYRGQDIVRHVEKLPSIPGIRYIHNPDYHKGSVLSLHAARHVMRSGEDTLLLDADVLFHPAILNRLCISRHENCLLFDRDFIPGDEPVKIALRGGAIVEFRKSVPSGLEYDDIGESVGYFKFGGKCAARVADACAAYVAEGKSDAPHEEALRDVLLQCPDRFGFEDISGLPWLEVDFAEDIERAEKEVLPAIRSEFPGF